MDRGSSGFGGCRAGSSAASSTGSGLDLELDGTSASGTGAGLGGGGEAMMVGELKSQDGLEVVMLTVLTGLSC